MDLKEAWNMNSDLISIVIPVYKVEKYLNRCIESVLRQTYTNIEAILVDDGSPDGCGELCDRFVLKDSRIKSYHKANGGLSDARNYGVERANGTYITFIDSDDYIAPDYIEYLYQLLRKYDADISCCCMVETEDDHAEYCVNTEIPSEQLLTGQEASVALLNHLYMVLVTACGKLYRSEIVRKYPFPVGRKHEDEATTCKFYYEAQKVAVGNRCLYAYYQNPESITHTKGSALNMDAIWALEHRARFYERQNDKKLAAYAWYSLFEYYVQDSKHNAGRCDGFLQDFKTGRTLLKRTRFDVSLYNTSHWAYWQYKNIWNTGSCVKAKLKSFRQKG